MKRLLSSLLIGCLIPFLTGCFTSRLWEGDAMMDHHFPSAVPKLQLFEAADHKDVLVEYDEERDKDERIKRRAFFLKANEKKLAAGRVPHFVNLRTAGSLQPIPVQSSSEAGGTNSPADLGMKAVLSPDSHSFTLVSGGREIASYELPNYMGAAGKWKRIALTPVAILGDTIVVCAGVAVVAAAAYVCGHRGDAPYGAWQ